MRPTNPRPQFARLVIGARVFGLVLLTSPILWSRDTTAALALVAVGVIWLAATAAERLRVGTTLVVVVEAALVGTVCALSLSLSASLAVLGALAVPPFTASVQRGPRGMLLALSAELTALVTLVLAVRGPMAAEEGTGTFTWVLMGLGLGLIGSFLRTAMHVSVDPLAPYRDAQALIRELIDLSGGLSSGLDPTPLASTVAQMVRNELPVRSLVVYVPRDDDLSPLLTEVGPGPHDAGRLGDLARSAQRTVRSVREEGAFAFPLMTDAGLVAVVAGSLPESLDPDGTRLESRLEGLAGRLEPTAVHLDTALLFSALRDSATADERRRLAREMHDGIAQDIASLGYLVDSLASRPGSAEQAVKLQQLRHRLSAVVTEVRRSVQTLRTDIGVAESLGSAIGAFGRHLSEAAGVPIRVTVDEHPARLRSEVEAELLRIAQEAMTNAVRHARASLIEVSCRVHAPTAEITVRDDGRGLGAGRPDSQGIEIMRERARLIDADLSLGPAEPRGTVVTVRLAAPPGAPDRPTSESRITA